MLFFWFFLCYNYRYYGGDSINNLSTESNNIVYGRNACLELLKSERSVEFIYIQKGEGRSGSITKIVAIAKERGYIVKETVKEFLDTLTNGGNHQGVAVRCAEKEYITLEELLESGTEFVVMCDEIMDPHNLGAIIRTASACGAKGVIITGRRSVGVTATVIKTSAGTATTMPVARVGNLVATAKKLKEDGFWLYACERGGTAYYDLNYSGKVCLVVGGEGTGISRLLLKECDFISTIPMPGDIESLNASVAAGVVLCEIAKQRGGSNSAERP